MPISSALGSSALLPAALGMRNKVVNGDMRINQRGNGAVTTNNSDPVDQWTIWNGTGTVSFQQSTTAPPGFLYSLLATVSSTGSYGTTGYTQIQNKIEGLNCHDLAFGTSSARPVVLSFWCRASVTGTYAVQLRNGAANRSYVATYTVSSQNTWEYKVIKIQGDTSGTWATDNTTGVDIIFNLGVGTDYDTTTPNAWVAGDKGSTSSCVDFAANSGATFYLTGVQLERNEQATPFEHRPIGAELAFCQRYYQRMGSQDLNGAFYATTAAALWGSFPVEMRTAPAVDLPAAPWTNSLLDYGVAFRTPSNLQAQAVTPRTLVILAYNGYSATYIPTTWYGGTFGLRAEL